MDASRPDESRLDRIRRPRGLTGGETWLGLLVICAAVLASEEWGVAGALVAGAAAAGVALTHATRTAWPVTVAALGTAGAASIHFAVAAPHLREWWGYGVFFLATAWAQLVWAAVAPRLPQRRLLWVGLAGNLALTVLWAVTRTTGLPLGPTPGESEPIGGADVVATVFELIAVAACSGALVGFRRGAGRTRWPLAIAVSAVTTYGLTAAAGAH